jgi:hypothetical protein
MLVFAASVIFAVILMAATRKRRHSSDVPPPAGSAIASPEQAEAFFRDPRNCSGKSLEQIFDILGQPADYDDWDLGRLVYTWRNAHRCVRIHAHSGRLQAVELMNPVDTPRFGVPLEVIWEKR